MHRPSFKWLQDDPDTRRTNLSALADAAHEAKLHRGHRAASFRPLRAWVALPALALAQERRGQQTPFTPAAADWTRALRDRLRAVTQQAGADAVGEALIGELGAAWSSLPEQVRRIFTHNGPAVLADLEGKWLQADPAALATIDQPTLLVAGTDSPPELRDPNDVMADALPNARTVLVGGGHLIDPADAVVLAFLEEVLG